MRHLLLLAILAICPAMVVAGDRPAKKALNIVFIISDDQGPADYGFLGHPHIKTPNLDRLAAQSLVYPNGYVTSSICCPSLASIITGMYPHQTKVTSNDPPKKEKSGPAKNAEDLRGRQWYAQQMSSLPSVLRQLAGLRYFSLQTGKWWHGNFKTGGFTHGMSHGDPQKQGRHGDAGLAIGRKTMEPIFDFIKEATAAGRPFVVWYAPMLPHLPHDPGDKYVAPYRDKAPSLAIAKYWGNITRFDDTCGQLLDYLDKNGLTENTIVVYLCDNGWIQDAQTGASIRAKYTQYEAGHRTPIMIRWPGRAAPGRSNTRVSAIDIAPTLLQAVGAPIPKEMVGLNLLDAEAVKSRKAVFGECFFHDAVDLDNPAANLRWRWVIEGPWRLVVPSANEPKAVVELYNLDDDLDERTNLAAREPERVRRLQALLDDWWPGTSKEPRIK